MVQQRGIQIIADLVTEGIGIDRDRCAMRGEGDCENKGEKENWNGFAKEHFISKK